MDMYCKDDPYERFQLIVNGPALFNAIGAGIELRVFHLLSEHNGATFNELAGHTGLGDHQLRVLMFALGVTMLIEKEGDKYLNTPLAEDYLASDKEDSWSHILLGWQRVYYPAFTQTTEALRRGTNIALGAYPGSGRTLYERLSQTPDLQQLFYNAMAAFTLRSLPGLLNNADLSTVSCLLDIGGGDGCTARAIARRFPGIEVTIFDFPPVAALASQSLSPGEEENVKVCAGDFLRDPFPQGVDAVLFSHVLEVFDEEHICGLLRRAYDSLRSGGHILIYGFNASGDETSGPLGARLTLYLNVLATGYGMSYPAADYERWLQRAGFRNVRTTSGLPYEHGLTVGYKEDAST